MTGPGGVDRRGTTAERRSRADSRRTADAPRIVVTFAGPGQAELRVGLDHVTPHQLYAAAFELEATAREVRQGLRIAAAQQQVQVANLAAAMRNGGRG